MEQDQRRNEWVQLTQDNFSQAFQEQAFIPEDYTSVQNYDSLDGYFPVQGDTPTGSQDGYSDSLGLYPSPYSARQTRQTNSDSMDDEALLEQEARDFATSQRRKRKGKGKGAKPKQEQPKSSRQIRRQQIAEENQGEVSATDQPKGLVERRQGVLRWWDPVDQMWQKAAYHDEYRDQFISEDTAEGRYVVVPAGGKGANDITTPCSAFRQLEWDINDRSSWGNILDNDGNKVMYLLDRPRDQSYDIPDRLWIHDGCVLLDGDNNPVRPWAGVPRCFSTKIEGGRMEALRRILPLTIQDFRARMLRHVPTSRSDMKPLSYPSTFGHRMARFRTQYQCPAWEARAASEVLRKQVTDQLSEGEEATTTEGLQVLTSYEIERRKLETRGKYLYKATGRALSEEERKERDRKLDEKLARQAADYARTTQRRQNGPGTPSQSTSPSPYLPTPPLTAGKKRRLEDDSREHFDIEQLEPATKRARRDGVSRVNPRLQSPLPTLFEDQSEQATATYRASSPADPRRVFHGHAHSQAGSSKSHQTHATKTPKTLSSHTPLIPNNNNNNNNPSSDRDYRLIAPRTLHEQLLIQSALFYPRAHYRALTGEHAPYTTTGTYTDQYFQLVAHLERKCAGNVPALADVGPWTGSFEAVPRPRLRDEVVRGILGLGASSTAAAVGRAEEVDGGGGGAAGGVPMLPKSEDDADGWSDDFFTGYLGHLDGDGDPFASHPNVH